MNDTDNPTLGDCPACGTAWAVVADNGKVGSHIVGVYSRGQDRIVEWQCPFCDARFPRGAIR